MSEAVTKERFLSLANDLPQQVVDSMDLDKTDPAAEMAPFESLLKAYQDCRARAIRNTFWYLTGSFSLLAGIGLFSGSTDFALAGMLLGIAAAGLYFAIRVFMSSSNDTLIKQSRERYMQEISRLWAKAVVEKQIAQDEKYLESRTSLGVWQQTNPAPSAQPFGVSPAGAEAWVCDWMVHMGAAEARTTQLSGDGGIDVESTLYIAQVKHYTNSVSIADIRAHIGVAAIDPGKRFPLFFTSGTYPESAVQAADAANMALFTYDVSTGVVTAENAPAGFLMRASFEPKWWPSSDADE